MITPILPYWTWIISNPPAIPKLYYGAVSVEQRDLEICKKIAGIESYLKYLSEATAKLSNEIRAEIEATIDEIEEQLEAELETLRRDLQEQIRDLIQWVQEQTFSVQTWDVTRGLRDNSVETMRRIFFDVTTEGVTVDELATNSEFPTVDDLANSGFNCRALAVIGARILGIENQTQWAAI